MTKGGLETTVGLKTKGGFEAFELLEFEFKKIDAG
jgi:hypothetical protein